MTLRPTLSAGLGAVLVMLALSPAGAWCQTPAPPTASASQAATAAKADDDALLKYAGFLREEAKSHREFLESYYSMTAAGLTAVVALFGGLLVWMNWRTKEDIRRQVEGLFREHAEKVVQTRVKQFDDYVAATRADVDRFISETRVQLDGRIQGINGVLLDLSAQATISRQSDATSDNSRLSGRRVLWVDDVPSNNDYPREILTTAGVAFDLALSTDDALEQLQRNKYDLVISDMGRGRNYTAGLDLLREMKQRGHKIPVVIYASARGVSQHGPTARALGAVETIHGTTLLLQSVQRILASTSNPSSAGGAE